MNKTDYYHYKAHGICVDCRQYDAAPGKITCEVCAAKRAEREVERYRSMASEKKSEYLKKHAESCKERYRSRKSKGLCVRCGLPQAKGSERLCISCLAKEKEGRRRELQRAELPSYGICYLCCKEPITKGKKLCAKCYEKSLKSLEIARNADKEKQQGYFRYIEHVDFLQRTQKGE